jgi:hypothetical protein
MLLWFQMSPLLLGFHPSETLYASRCEMSPLFWVNTFRNIVCFRDFKRAPFFWASFLPERCTLLWFQVSPLLLGFVPSGMLYAYVIPNEPLSFGLHSFRNVVRFYNFKWAPCFWASFLWEHCMLPRFWLIEPVSYGWARFAHGSNLLGLWPVEY